MRTRVVLTCLDFRCRLYISINEISDDLGTMKANADDQYKLIQLRSQEYRDIVAEYKKTWLEYRVSSNAPSLRLRFPRPIRIDDPQAVYEEFPLAKARNAVKLDLERLKIEHMVMSYKKAEVMTVIKQRRRINWIRTRCRIIEFVTVMLENLRLERKFVRLKVNVRCHTKELQAVEAEVYVKLYSIIYIIYNILYYN